MSMVVNENYYSSEGQNLSSNIINKNDNFGSGGNHIANAVTEGLKEFINAGGGLADTEFYLNHYDYD